MTHRRALFGGVAMGVGAVATSGAVAAPSARVRVGVIGVRGRGTDLVGMFAADRASEVVAICDIDDTSFARPLEALGGGQAAVP